MADPYAQFTGPAAAGAAPAGAPADPYAQFTGAPGASGGGFTIDFTKPQDQVGAQIKALPQQYQQQAFKDYGDFVGQTNQGEGGFLQGAANFGRSALQGLTMDWLDEATAGIKTLGGTIGDYDTQLAIQQGINRKSDEAGGLAGTAGYVVGSVAPALLPVGWLGLGARGAVAGGRALAPTALRAAGVGAAEGAGFGAIQGAGSADAGLGNRLQGAAIGGGLGAVGGGVLGGGIAAGVHKYGTRQLAATAAARTDPNIEHAAAQFGADLPFFMRAQDPAIAEAGARFAQRPAEAVPAAAQVRTAMERGIQGIGEGAEREVLQRSGAGALEGVLTQGGEAIRNVVGTRATQIEHAMGAAKQALLNDIGASTPVPLTNFRLALGNEIADRMQKGWTNPWEGLEQFGNLARGGMDMDIATQMRTELGETLRVRPLVQADAARQPAVSKLYGALSDDIAETANRSGKLQSWQGYNAAVKELADERRLLRSSFPDKAQPEQMVRSAQGWMSTAGTGPRGNRVQAFEDAMRATRSSQPNVGQEAAQALYADTLMRSGNAHAGGSPQRVATALDRQTTQGRTLIENMDPATADLMRQHQLLGDRVRDMMNARNQSGTAPAMEAAGMGRRVTDSLVSPVGGALMSTLYAGNPIVGALMGAAGKGVRGRYDRAQQQRMAQYYLTGRRPGLLPTLMRPGGP